MKVRLPQVSHSCIYALCILLSFILLSNSTYAVQSQEESNILEVATKVHFPIAIPVDLPEHWGLEVNTLPFYDQSRVDELKLLYHDERSGGLIVAIDQKPYVGIDVSEVFAYKRVSINGNIGFFQTTKEKMRDGGDTSTRKLTWVEDNTKIQMTSAVLTEEQMLKLARKTILYDG
ncbi:hypothetical protein [Evansella cellulosilytica]|uniref:DUF4367 domain-containing protein n=1 Tax=Evansella cellulosilytica (strain ATCC 21833 / DSM 2522 / FERM P-1141 / JCM 9156 / N-4) TaxID=649639 RepID=E6TUJ4_EVAC2|nr:hypothetical protein [Evansella cellulosilytica]ADU30884.1 hypothetical protein Bcell_2627 [Evansella cellulosilytica DSM 2522]